MNGQSFSGIVIRILIKAVVSCTYSKLRKMMNRIIRWPDFTATLRLSLKQLLLTEILTFDYIYIYIYSAFWFIIGGWYEEIKITILKKMILNIFQEDLTIDFWSKNLVRSRRMWIRLEVGKTFDIEALATRQTLKMQSFNVTPSIIVHLVMENATSIQKPILSIKG